MINDVVAKLTCLGCRQHCVMNSAVLFVVNLQLLISLKNVLKIMFFSSCKHKCFNRYLTIIVVQSIHSSRSAHS